MLRVTQRGRQSQESDPSPFDFKDSAGVKEGFKHGWVRNWGGGRWRQFLLMEEKQTAFGTSIALSPSRGELGTWTYF